MELDHTKSTCLWKKCSIILFLLAVVIGLSAIADKIRLPYPILLVTAGIAVGFIPGMPKTELEPDIVFLLFRPPMLYDAAFTISWLEFKKNINTISTLAFALVFLTASGMAIRMAKVFLQKSILIVPFRKPNSADLKMHNWTGETA